MPCFGNASVRTTLKRRLPHLQNVQAEWEDVSTPKALCLNQTACCKSFLPLTLCTGSSCRSTDKSAVKCKQTKMLARRLCAHSRCRGQPRSPHPPQSAPNILCRWTMRGLESAFIFKLGVAHLSPQRPPYTSGHTKLHPQLARAHLPRLFA